MKMEIKPTGFNFAGRLVIGLLVAVLTIVAHAQSQEQARQYISPRLQLGIHTQPALDSPIKELISSGSAVEVIKTQEDFTEVKTEEGTQGWIKSKFLTPEEPAELKIKQMQEQLLQTQQQLQAAQGDRETLEAETEQESDIGSHLAESQVAAYEETIAGLRAEIKAWEQLDSQDKQAQKEQAEQINQHIKARLLKIAALATGKEMNEGQLNLPQINGAEKADELIRVPFLKVIKKEYLINLVVGGICFFLGIFLMDLFNRRRHGGYRV